MTNVTALPGLIQFGQASIKKALEDCAADADGGSLLAVDATCGNGHDSLFLAKTLYELGAGGTGRLIALDIQQQALDNARQLLAAHGVDRLAAFLLQSHADLGPILENWQNRNDTHARPAAVMYNLGYLPGSDKQIITLSQSTLTSLETATENLGPKGLISIHAYGGHPGGFQELEAVDAWCANLSPTDWTVARYSMHNKPRKPEALFLLQRRTQHERRLA